MVIRQDFKAERQFWVFFQVSPTNYAVIRSILYSSKHDQGSGEPCCVPIKLRGLSTMEYRKKNLIMEFYKEMIVEECGCR